MDGDGAISKQELWTFLRKQVKHLVLNGSENSKSLEMSFLIG